jgi:DtxR family manganese transport transcriptional regulator
MKATKARATPESSLVDADTHVESFRQTRHNRRTELVEDYVELIADLIEQTGEARVVDLAGRLGVTKSTVNNTVQRLQRDGLLSSKPYRSIFLTEKGQALATASRERHALVREFLVALGVDAETAEADAEGIEHHVSDATLAAFRLYLGKRRPAG